MNSFPANPVLLVTLIQVVLTHCECRPPEPPPTPEAYFEFEDAHGDRFIFKLVEQDKIDHARGILSGEVTDMLSVSGTIVKQPAEYNPGWSFHLDAESVEFFDF